MKTFCENQTANQLKEFIQPPSNPPPTGKVLLRQWKKTFLKEICRNIQRFPFRVLQECSSWALRDGAVQIFFLISNRHKFARKFVKSERLLAVVSESMFVK